jgi:hypothetical protein
MWKRAFVVAVLAAVAGALGCESLAGIEDRTYDLADPSAASPACESYCDDVMEFCVGPDAAYSGRETCLGTCAKLDPGDSLEPAGNTLACRAAQAKLAGSVGEPAIYCQRAGPGGDDTCGSNCESYCQLMERSCPTQHKDVPGCVAKCEALNDVNRFDVIEDHGGDTLQCRLVHVSSATVEPEDHCPHAQFRPTEPWCIAKDPPQCADYCRVVMVACTGSLAQYETLGQCMSACAALPPGKLADQTAETDTVGCRTYHSYSSLADPATHCAHSGPGGDGHCGGSNCPSYCLVAKSACSAEFAAKFPGDLPACELDCGRKDGAEAESKFSTTNAGSTISCRTLHALRAFADPTECGPALGTGGCP